MTLWLDMLGTEIRYVETKNFGRIRIAETGDKAAPALILQHGMGGHLEAYCKNMHALGAHFHTIAFDYVGHGLSTRQEREYTPLVLAEQLGELMDALGIGRAHLSGESLGGWVAGFFAAKYPERVNRLQLNTAGGIPISPKGLEDMAVFRALSQKVAGLPPTYDSVRDRIKWLIHPDHHNLITDELVNLRLHYYTMPEGRAAMPLVNAILPRHDEFLLPLESIQARTQFLWTRDNPIHDLNSAIAAQKRVPDSTIYVMQANACHWPQYEAPEEFNRVTVEFFK